MTFYYGQGEYPVPVEIDEDQITEVIQGFAGTAVRAVKAGFDGIEIDGANGYLLDQFLTAETNQRTDRWGGDAKNRVALLVEVVTAVKAAVGDAVPVGIRISQGKVNDFTSRWAGREAEAKIILSAVAEAGVDFIHVTEFEAWKPAFEGGRDSLLALARRFAPGVAIIANGGLHDAGRAEEALATGADLIALGRGALANPDFPKVIEAQQEPRAFDSAVLGPIANIKNAELAFGTTG